jgi:decaprenyl-phosphate phosphoribosyltransferase
VCPDGAPPGKLGTVEQPKEPGSSNLPRAANVPDGSVLEYTERPSRGATVRALVSTARPQQWTKNLLVFAAPATGRVLLEPGVLPSTVAAFVAFCLVSSGMYFLNDVVDASADRRHHSKRLRPIAAGLISPRLGMLVGTVFLAVGSAVATWAGGLLLLTVMVAYIALFLAYTFVLRSIALLDLAAIAGGFLLRTVAGGVAAEVPLSMWFLMVAGFGSFFLAAGKRRAEYLELGEERAMHRASLTEYSEPYLRYVQYSTSTVAIAAYAQWAFEGPNGGSVWSELSIIPFVLGIFRYALLLEQGRGAAPENAVLTDKPLIVLGTAWVLLVIIGVYVL